VKDKRWQQSTLQMVQGMPLRVQHRQSQAGHNVIESVWRTQKVMRAARILHMPCENVEHDEVRADHGWD
jgi:hypothetical protein